MDNRSELPGTACQKRTRKVHPCRSPKWEGFHAVPGLKKSGCRAQTRREPAPHRSRWRTKAISRFGRELLEIQGNHWNGPSHRRTLRGYAVLPHAPWRNVTTASHDRIHNFSSSMTNSKHSVLLAPRHFHTMSIVAFSPKVRRGRLKFDA